MSKSESITLYAQVAFTDANGQHAVDDAVTMPYNSDAEKAEVQGMLAYGVLGQQPKGKKDSA